MNRRDILTAALAAPALAVPVGGEAASETSVMALFREWCQLWGKCEGLCEADEWSDNADELSAKDMRMSELEDEMMRAPKRGMGDVLMTVAAVSNFGDIIYEHGFWAAIRAEARALVGDGAGAGGSA